MSASSGSEKIPPLCGGIFGICKLSIFRKKQVYFPTVLVRILQYIAKLCGPAAGAELGLEKSDSGVRFPSGPQTFLFSSPENLLL